MAITRENYVRHLERSQYHRSQFHNRAGDVYMGAYFRGGKPTHDNPTASAIWTGQICVSEAEGGESHIDKTRQHKAVFLLLILGREPSWCHCCLFSMEAKEANNIRILSEQRERTRLQLKSTYIYLHKSSKLNGNQVKLFGPNYASWDYTRQQTRLFPLHFWHLLLNFFL